MSEYTANYTQIVGSLLGGLRSGLAKIFRHSIRFGALLLKSSVRGRLTLGEAKARLRKLKKE